MNTILLNRIENTWDSQTKFRKPKYLICYCNDLIYYVAQTDSPITYLIDKIKGIEFTTGTHNLKQDRGDNRICSLDSKYLVPTGCSNKSFLSDVNKFTSKHIRNL